MQGDVTRLSVSGAFSQNRDTNPANHNLNMQSKIKIRKNSNYFCPKSCQEQTFIKFNELHDKRECS